MLVEKLIGIPVYLLTTSNKNDNSYEKNKKIKGICFGISNPSVGIALANKNKKTGGFSLFNYKPGFI